MSSSIELSGIDTSDATATAAKILSGFTAYAKGSKITGNYVPLDTSDATATADKILSGFTAYAKGSKVTGNYAPANSYKIYYYYYGMNFSGGQTFNTNGTDWGRFYDSTGYNQYNFIPSRNGYAIYHYASINKGRGYYTVTKPDVLTAGQEYNLYSRYVLAENAESRLGVTVILFTYD